MKEYTSSPDFLYSNTLSELFILLLPTMNVWIKSCKKSSILKCWSWYKLISTSLIKLLIKLINYLKGLKQSDFVDGNVKKSIIVSFIENENDDTLLTLFNEIGIEDTKEKQFSLRKVLQLFDHIESNQIIRNNLDNTIKETEEVIRLLRGLKDEKEEYITLLFNATRRFLFRYLNEEILPSEFLDEDNIADHMFEIPVLWDRELNTEREDTKFYTDVKNMKIQISQIKTFYELIKEHLNH